MHKAFRLLDLWRWEQTEDWNLEGRCGSDELSELEKHARTHGTMCDGWRELGFKRDREPKQYRARCAQLNELFGA